MCKKSQAGYLYFLGFFILAVLPAIAADDLPAAAFYRRLFLSEDSVQLNYTTLNSADTEVTIYKNQIIRVPTDFNFTLHREDQANYPVLIEVSSAWGEVDLYHLTFRDSLYPGASHDFEISIGKQGEIHLQPKPIQIIRDYSLDEMKSLDLIPWKSRGEYTHLRDGREGLHGQRRRSRETVKAFREGMPEVPTVHVLSFGKKTASPTDSIILEENVSVRFAPYGNPGDGPFGSNNYLYFNSKAITTPTGSEIVRSTSRVPAYTEHCRNFISKFASKVTRIAKRMSKSFETR